ncbi:hypothetical protein KL918_004948 [Ogataea parapolymorpha]|uniref:Membrane protein n=1 Tax=Ogataea parapolymorpha (strain ATCC 26012 / BCRC 20466 / JCM 22074 / NRRL Y-7560 / DL-1) TaxID=871575 RepID=W1QI91_OGAPD|nr:putative membrane protein [Ogataea parapolymorpha DL-1]ESX00159.1 putative membrane protein [Ogataea parapolymorpha DL-1]KAG7865072.1 hypothetical protein KL918_004948 [Ogataea parapolymorpha]KAG7872242.1 hypothetical protein KL916_003265 [Ogataea parapolymorpha]
MATAQNRSTEPTPYLCLKSRWLLAVWNEWTLFGGLVLAIVLLNGCSASSSSKSSSSLLNTSLSIASNTDLQNVQSVFLDDLKIVVASDLTAEAAYLNSTLNDTITTAYKAIAAIDLRPILQQLADSINDTVTSSLASQNSELESLKSTLNSQAVYVGTSVSLDKMNINYTWIGSYLANEIQNRTITNAYEKHFRNLPDYFAFFDSLTTETLQNVSAAFDLVDLSGPEIYNYSVSNASALHLTYLSSTTSKKSKAVYVLVALMVVFVVAQMLLDWLRFAHEQKQATCFPLEATEKTDFLEYTFRAVDFEAFKLAEVLAAFFGDSTRLNFLASFWLGVRSNAKNLGKYIVFSLILYSCWTQNTSSSVDVSLSGNTRLHNTSHTLKTDFGFGSESLLADIREIYDDFGAHVRQFLDDEGLAPFVSYDRPNSSFLADFSWPDEMATELTVAVNSTVSQAKLHLVQPAASPNARPLLYYAFALCVGATFTMVAISVYTLR